MGFLRFSKVICSVSDVSARLNESMSLVHTFPIPLFPKVAEVLVLSVLLLEDDPAGEP